MYNCSMANSKLKANHYRGKYWRRRVTNAASASTTGSSTTPDEVATTPATTTASTTLEGCRIINLDKLKEFTGQISKHSSSCGGEISLVGESRDGLASILKAQCHVCNMIIYFLTSSKVVGSTGNRHWECNISAVWGQMAIGGGYSHLQESMGALGIPVMTKKTFVTVVNLQSREYKNRPRINNRKHIE